MDECIKVIVAEDLDILREHFISIINAETDMRVIASASSGKQVVQLSEDLAVDVILMDIEMDVRHDGIEAAKRILSTHPQIRIVFLTVHEDDETVFGAFETGAVDYLLKTSNNHEIVKSIRSAYTGSSSIRPEIAYKIRNEFSRIRKNQHRIYDAMSIISELTPSEKEILSLLLQDKKVQEIAKVRQVEVSTIKSQINIILKKFKKNRSKEVCKLIKELDITNVFYNVGNRT